MAEKKPPTLKEALAAVDNMTCLSDGVFRKVDGLCRLALHALETPEGQRDAEAMAQVLKTIMHIVGEYFECIDSEAGTVGVVMPLDDGFQRRMAACVSANSASR